jgi:hypothetical protein
MAQSAEREGEREKGREKEREKERYLRCWDVLILLLDHTTDDLKAV